MTTSVALIVHPSVELYGSDQMLLHSVACLKRSFRVVVVLPGPGPLSEKLPSEVQVLYQRHLFVLRKGLLSPPSCLAVPVRFLVSLITLLAAMLRIRPSVVYANTVTVPAATIAARMLNISCVSHVHEAEMDLRPLFRRLLTASLLFADVVIAVSRTSEEFIVGSWPSLTQRTVIIPNPVRVSPVTSRPLPHASPTVLHILVPGRLSPRKGTDLALAVATELKRRGIRFKMTFAGSVYPGNERFEDELRAQVSKAGLRDLVEFMGWVNDMPAVYRAAEVVLVPSRQEPFGLVAIEAMAQGRILVASDVEGLREVVANGAAGHLVPPGIEEFAEALHHIRNNWRRSRAIASRGPTYVRTKFSISRYEADLCQAVERARRSPRVRTRGKEGKRSL